MARPAAFAADKPPSKSRSAVVAHDDIGVSATIEFGLPALASAIERDIPRRLATIDERGCVLGFRVNANCDTTAISS